MKLVLSPLFEFPPRKELELLSVSGFLFLWPPGLVPEPPPRPPFPWLLPPWPPRLFPAPLPWPPLYFDLFLGVIELLLSAVDVRSLASSTTLAKRLWSPPNMKWAEGGILEITEAALVLDLLILEITLSRLSSREPVNDAVAILAILARGSARSTWSSHWTSWN